MAEEKINMAALQEVLERFQTADEDGSGGIELDEFVDTFGDLLGDGKSADMLELKQLFMKIDADSNGSVDWDEFSNYLFLDNQSQSAGDESQQWAMTLCPRISCNALSLYMDAATSEPSSKMRKTAHHINRIRYVEHHDKYISVGFDGVARLYNPSDLSAYRGIQVTAEPTFITDVVGLTAQRRLCFSTMDNSLEFFDLARTGHYERLGAYHITSNTMGAPTCLSLVVRPNPSLDEEPLLMYGDTKGAVRFCPNVDLGPDNDLVLVRAADEEAHLPKLHDEHSDWVTKVEFVDDLNGYVSSSLDGSIKLCDVLTQRIKHTNRLHKKGVYSFAWCSAYSMFASCGFERDIVLWHGSTGKQVSVLAGHSSPVLEVAVDDELNRLFSISTDKVVKVWDLRSSKCMETITAFPEDETLANKKASLGTMFYHRHKRTRKRRLLVGTNQMTKIDYAAKQARFQGHHAPLCAALYNKEFGVVVSGDDNSAVITWRLKDGERQSKFQNAHLHEHTGDPVKITSMAFDHTGRRLLTGASDGSLKMWNFNNGALLKRFLHGDIGKEMTSVAYLQNPGADRKGGTVVGTGWGCNVLVWDDNSDRQVIESSRSLPGHKEDILSHAVYMSPSTTTIATGDYGGRIRLWNLNSGIMRLELMHSGHSGSYERSVDGLLFLEEIKHDGMPLLVSISADARLRIFSVGKSPGHAVYERWMGYKVGEPLTSVCTDERNEYLFLGCARGSVRVLDISLLRACFDDGASARSASKASSHGVRSGGASPRVPSSRRNSRSFDVVRGGTPSAATAGGSRRPSGERASLRVEDCNVTSTHFRAHSMGIAHMAYIDEYGLLLLAGKDENVSLWTPSGGLVGIFAIDNWDLSDRGTWHDAAGKDTEFVEADAPPMEPTAAPDARSGSKHLPVRITDNGVCYDSPPTSPRQRPPRGQIAVDSPRSSGSVAPRPVGTQDWDRLVPPQTAGTEVSIDLGASTLPSTSGGDFPTRVIPFTAPPILADLALTKRGRIKQPPSYYTAKALRARQRGTAKLPTLNPAPVKGEVEAEMRRRLGLPAVDAPSIVMSSYFRARDSLKERRTGELQRPQTVHSKIGIHKMERIPSTTDNLYAARHGGKGGVKLQQFQTRKALDDSRTKRRGGDASEQRGVTSFNGGSMTARF